MRLIDADEFKEIILTYGKAGYRALTIEKISELIDAQYTAYNVDKVVERLEEYAHSSICKTHEHGCPYLTNDGVSCENCGAIGALEIVKSGGIE